MIINFINSSIDYDSVEIIDSKNKHKKYIHCNLIETIDSCPYCGNTKIVHNDSRTRNVIDGTSYGYEINITLKLRKYKCKKCNNSFYEYDTFSFEKSSYSRGTVIAAFETLKKKTVRFLIQQVNFQ